jgi:peptidyl-prolyl cis-trans isomerase SurA
MVPPFAVIFFCSDETTGKNLADQLKKDPANWKKTVETMNEKVVADSARYEWSQIPGIDKSPKAGTITSLTLNSTDKTASLAFIGRVYPQASPRSFNEAKGLVMNDLQTQLEQEWIQRLKKKYPVVVDQKVLNSISK